MLNLIQHLIKSRAYETLKQVQGDKSGLFTRPSTLVIGNPPFPPFSKGGGWGDLEVLILIPATPCFSSQFSGANH